SSLARACRARTSSTPRPPPPTLFPYTTLFRSGPSYPSPKRCCRPTNALLCTECVGKLDKLRHFPNRHAAGALTKQDHATINSHRSEERRVGKECRSRWET